MEKEKYLLMQQVRVAAFEQLADTMDQLALQSDRYVVRGEVITPSDKPQGRWLSDRTEGKATLRDAPRRQLFLDLDCPVESFPEPAGPLDAAYAAEVWRRVGMLEAAFEGAECWWTFTANAGVKRGVRMRFMVWLREPVTSKEVARWGAAINDRVGFKLFDTQVFNANQAHLIAAPILNGNPDPCRQRFGRLEGGDCGALPVPAVAEGKARKAKGAAEQVNRFTEEFIPTGTAEPLTRAAETYLSRLAPGSFNEPIKAAIGAAVGAGCADDAIAARILDCVADRGGPARVQEWRTKLPPLLAWTRDQEAQKRERELARAQPHPGIDGLLPIAEAHEKMREALRGWGKAASGFLETAALTPSDEAPQPPRLFANVGVGIGKTEAAISLIAALLRSDGPIRRVTYLVPTHRLSAELAGRFARAGLDARVWYGAGAEDAEGNPLVCKQPALRDAATPIPGGLEQACKRCPSAQGCAYLAQKAAQPQVWIAAHEHLFKEPTTTMGAVQALVVDEAFWSKGLKGVDKPAQLLFSTLQASLRDAATLSVDERDDLEASRAMLLQALHTIPEDGRLTADALLRAGFTETRVTEAHKLEWRLKPQLSEALLGCEGQPDAMIRVFTAMKASRFSPLVPRLWKQAAALLRGETVQVVRREIKAGDAGYGSAVEMAWRSEIHESWGRLPALLLDATGQRAIVEQFWGPIETVEVQAALPDHVRVTQVVETTGALTAFVRKDFQPDDGRDASRAGNVKRLREWIEVEAKYPREDGTLRNVGVISQLEVERRLAPGQPGNVALAHFGAIEGRDHLRDVDTLLVVGRTQPNPETVEKIAAALFSKDIETLGGGRYPTATVRLHGTTQTVEADRHPDRYAEMVRWAIAEAGVIQAIGRARAVQRRADQPLRVVIVGAMAVPTIAPHDLVPWEDFAPDRWSLAGARFGVVPRTPLAMVATGLWPSLAAARKALIRAEAVKGGHPPINSPYREMSPFKSRYRFRQTPEQRRWSEVDGPADPEEARRCVEVMFGQVMAHWDGAAPEPAVVLEASATLPEGITHPLRAHEESPAPIQWTTHALSGSAIATATGHATVNVEVALQGIAVSCIAGILSPHTSAASADPPPTSVPAAAVAQLAQRLGVGRHPLRRMMQTLQQAPPGDRPPHLIALDALIELRGYSAVMDALQELLPSWSQPQDSMQEDAEHG